MPLPRFIPGPNGTLEPSDAGTVVMASAAEAEILRQWHAFQAERQLDVERMTAISNDMQTAASRALSRAAKLVRRKLGTSGDAAAEYLVELANLVLADRDALDADEL